jgi:hypothetical protein
MAYYQKSAHAHAHVHSREPFKRIVSDQSKLDINFMVDLLEWDLSRVGVLE